jgi:hypothetical protein
LESVATPIEHWLFYSELPDRISATQPDASSSTDETAETIAIVQNQKTHFNAAAGVPANWRTKN